MVELLQRVALFEFAETVINGEERRSYLYYYLRGFPCLDSSFFSSKMPLHLYV